MIRDSLPHTFLLMPREELNDVNLEDLLIYFSEVKSRGLHKYTIPMSGIFVS
jgi:hypothetical protein